MGTKLISFDWAMKKLLRSKANFGILEGFLSELLKQDVKIQQLLESESNKDDHDDKQNRVDILVQLASGEIALIEVQVNIEQDYLYRMLYGVSKVVTQCLKQGDPYQKIKKIYSINILYFDIGQGKDYLYHGTTKFVGVYQRDELDLNKKQKEFYNKSYLHQIYPEYYLIKINNFDDVAKNTLDEWVYFLKNEEIKDSFKAQGLLEAKSTLDTMKLSEEEKCKYKRYLEDLHYHASMIEVPYHSGLFEGEKVGIEKGKQLGIEEGKQLGIEEGKQLGIEEGKQLGKQEGEQKSKVEIASNMKKLGIAVNLIQQTTGLSEKEIDKI